jgi:hypothetical protein
MTPQAVRKPVFVFQPQLTDEPLFVLKMTTSKAQVKTRMRVGKREFAREFSQLELTPVKREQEL